jgi:hypothetical protein
MVDAGCHQRKVGSFFYERTGGSFFFFANLTRTVGSWIAAWKETRHLFMLL